MAYTISEMCKTLKVVEPKNKPKGWDVADAIDEGMGKPEIIKYIQANITDYERPPEPPMVEPDIENEDPKTGGIRDSEAHFKFLGYTDRKYYFLRYATGIIKEFSGNQLGQLGNLIELAPYEWWKEKWLDDYKSKKEALLNLSSALVQISESVGVFNPQKVRGRGAWKDRGRYVYHCGE